MSSNKKQNVGPIYNQQGRRNSGMDQEMYLKELIWSLKGDIGEMKKEFSDFKIEMNNKVKGMDDKLDRMGGEIEGNTKSIIKL